MLFTSELGNKNAQNALDSFVWHKLTVNNFKIFTVFKSKKKTKKKLAIV